MLRALIEKVDNMQEQIDNVTKEMEILKNNQKARLEIKNTVIEMKNAFEKLIGWLNIAEERISELKNMTIETSEIEKVKRKMTEKKERTEYKRIVEELQKI